MQTAPQAAEDRAVAPPTPRPAGGSRAASARRPALLAALALVLVALPLAAPGADLVPGAASGAPGWLLGVYGPGLGIGAGLYLGLFYVAVIAWVAVLLLTPRLGRRGVATLAGLLIAAFALAPPLLSLDVFSYISYARLGALHDLNPYAHAPAAIPGDPAAARVDDFRDAVSVYGPLFTLLSYPLGLLGVPAALWSLKALAALSIAALAALTARLAERRGVDPAFAVAFVALNPVVLVHLVGGAHNDGLMALLAVAGIAALLAERPLAAAAGLAAAVAVKVAAAVYVPFALLGARRLRPLVALLTLIAAGVAISLGIFGPHVSEALGVVSGNQETVSRWSVPGTLSRALGIDSGVLRAGFAVAYGLAALALLAWVARGADWVRATGWAVCGLLVASSYMAPWYLIWLLPVAAISRDRALLAAAVALTAFQVANGVPA